MNYRSNESICDRCSRLAAMIGGPASCRRDVCIVIVGRPDLDSVALGRPTRSPQVLAGLFTFDDLDQEGRSLNWGQVVLREGEVAAFVERLRRHNIREITRHNHWLAEKPLLIRVEWKAVMDPFRFAEASASALATLR